MKKMIFAAIAGMLLAGCSSDNVEEQGEETVTLRFSGFQVETESMTRATSAIGDYVTKLDVWIYESGSEVSATHQSSGDAGFGSLSLTLNKTKTYTLYAVAHKANGAATLADGVISWPDDKVTHSFFYSTTFTPATDTDMNCVMNRIVAMLRLETTDAIPSECKKMRVTIDGVYDRWNVATGGTHQVNRVSTINISSTNPDGTAAFTMYAIVTGENTNHRVTMEALDADDAVLKSHVLENVPFCINKKTIISGAFFPDVSGSFSFLASDIEELTTIEF